MILCDIGNTSYHFLDGERDYKESVADFDPSIVTKRVYYISVNSSVKERLQELKNWIDLEQFIDRSRYYSSMGIDRVVALEGIENAVVVDAGSAITIDVVRDGIFEGGFIYPGVQAMSKSYSSISPALEYPFNFDLDLKKLPKNSQDAISYGFLKLLYSEVSAYNLPIILTGGDALAFKKLFTEAKVDKLLLFESMKKLIIKL